jgi:hypothetical protein
MYRGLPFSPSTYFCFSLPLYLNAYCSLIYAFYLIYYTFYIIFSTFKLFFYYLAFLNKQLLLNYLLIFINY